MDWLHSWSNESTERFLIHRVVLQQPTFLEFLLTRSNLGKFCPRNKMSWYCSYFSLFPSLTAWEENKLCRAFSFVPVNFTRRHKTSLIWKSIFRKYVLELNICFAEKEEFRTCVKLNKGRSRKKSQKMLEFWMRETFMGFGRRTLSITSLCFFIIDWPIVSGKCLLLPISLLDSYNPPPNSQNIEYRKIGLQIFTFKVCTSQTATTITTI